MRKNYVSFLQITVSCKLRIYEFITQTYQTINRCWELIERYLDLYVNKQFYVNRWVLL